MWKRMVIISVIISFCIAGCNREEQANKSSVKGILSDHQIDFVIKNVNRVPHYDVWTAKNNYTLLVVNFSLKNSRNKSIIVKPSQFNVISETGKIYGVVQTKRNTSVLHDRKLKSYDSLQSSIIFEIPKEEMASELLFAPSFAKDKPIVISLK
ncbi:MULTISPECIES: DUF4352 domain-containing protein [unclassified Bacillus (in: firmicutes)]|uniref:DUF4352 domain-containing protein n=1 Tax=unclassified Bacillus (in: firmicutes) TaxID=185979 RepID=UPI0008EC84D2|nr:MULTISPECIES: DUF4352 domain-containing protein [unclassified Bacillus (in: firmicutes)]SFI53019.1 protein of unknown function [Bacillus sp. 71mf]SFS47794.1 protein of unknown function [Bacillus sp. 103mf]